MYKDYRAIEVSQNPSELLQQSFGSLANAGKALGVTPQTFRNWDSNKRLPYRVWKQMLDLPAGKVVQEATTSTTPIELRRPYRIGTSKRKGKDSPKASPKASTAESPTTTEKGPRKAAAPSSRSLADMVARLEQENTKLRRLLTNVGEVIRNAVRS